MHDHQTPVLRPGSLAALLGLCVLLSACPHDLRRFWLGSADGGGGAGDAAKVLDIGVPADGAPDQAQAQDLHTQDQGTTTPDKGSTSPDQGSASQDKGTASVDKGSPIPDAGPPPYCQPCTGQGVYCSMICTYKGGTGTLSCTGFGSLFTCSCVGKSCSVTCWSGTVPIFGCDVCKQKALVEPKCITLLANNCCP